MFQDARIYTKSYPNGFLLSSMGAILTRESSMDLFPQRDLHIANIVGMPGSLNTNAVIQPRNMNLVIHFTLQELPIDSPFKYYTLDQLDEFLTAQFINDYEEYYIEFTDLEGKFYPVVWDSAKAPRLLLSDGIVNYNLIGYDPYVYGDLIQIKLGTSYRDLPQQSGTENSYPIIRCKANEPGTFTINTSGVTKQYTLNPSYTAEATGYIYFDTYRRTMVDDSGRNMLPFYKGTFPLFQPGKSIKAILGSSTTDVLFSYRSRSLY